MQTRTTRASSLDCRIRLIIYKYDACGQQGQHPLITECNIIFAKIQYLRKKKNKNSQYFLEIKEKVLPLHPQ